MAGLGRKVFTAGDVLTASDVQNYLMDQTVMNFAGTAARSSAIATPTTGMTTYIGTTGTATIPQLETYTGSAWQTPYGLTQVANVSFTSATAVQVENVFTATYDAYMIQFIINGFAGGSTAVLMQVVSGSTPNNTAGNYQTCGLEQPYSSGTISTTFNNGSGASLSIGRLDSARQGGSFQTYLINPFATQFTTMQSTYTDGGYHGRSAGIINVNTSYNGMRFFLNSGSAVTGLIRIYGLRNS
jgi:hypothetical protein